ncbi:hypothetical protein NHX12_024193, partial [Muraenolepis orangiensis]
MGMVEVTGLTCFYSPLVDSPCPAWHQAKKVRCICCMGRMAEDVKCHMTSSIKGAVEVAC